MPGEDSNTSGNALEEQEFEFGLRKIPPPLEELLEHEGCLLFLDAIRKAGSLEGLNAVTLLAPCDIAFYSGVCGREAVMDI